MKLKYAPLIAAAIALAGCGSLSASSSGSSGSTAAQSVPSSVQAAPSSPDCNSEVVSWRDSGGSAQLTVFTADLTAVYKADEEMANALDDGTSGSLSTAEGDLQSAAASLQSDAQAAEANLPPACVPHLKADYGAALTDYSKVAADCQNAVSELGSGSDDVAVSDIKAAIAQEDAGNGKLSAAGADITAFSN